MYLVQLVYSVSCQNGLLNKPNHRKAQLSQGTFATLSPRSQHFGRDNGGARRFCWWITGFRQLWFGGPAASILLQGWGWRPGCYAGAASVGVGVPSMNLGISNVEADRIQYAHIVFTLHTFARHCALIVSCISCDILWFKSQLQMAEMRCLLIALMLYTLMKWSGHNARGWCSVSKRQTIA